MIHPPNAGQKKNSACTHIRCREALPSTKRYRQCASPCRAAARLSGVVVQRRQSQTPTLKLGVPSLPSHSTTMPRMKLTTIVVSLNICHGMHDAVNMDPSPNAPFSNMSTDVLYFRCVGGHKLNIVCCHRAVTGENWQAALS